MQIEKFLDRTFSNLSLNLSTWICLSQGSPRESSLKSVCEAVIVTVDFNKLDMIFENTTLNTEFGYFLVVEEHVEDFLDGFQFFLIDRSTNLRTFVWRCLSPVL